MGKFNNLFLFLVIFYIKIYSQSNLRYNDDTTDLGFKINCDVGKLNVINTQLNKELCTVFFWGTTRISAVNIIINDSLAEFVSYSLDSGSLSSISHLKYINNQYVKNGIKYFFYEDGSISKLYTYKNNILNGLYLSYYKNGIIEIKGFFEIGEEVGVWIYYNEKGKIIKKEKH